LVLTEVLEPEATQYVRAVAGNPVDIINLFPPPASIDVIRDFELALSGR
jgi:hypothetical protein